MFILSQDKKIILNTDKIAKIFIVEGATTYNLGSYIKKQSIFCCKQIDESNSEGYKIAEYESVEEAEDVFNKILYKMRNGERTFEMP